MTTFFRQACCSVLVLCSMVLAPDVAIAQKPGETGLLTSSATPLESGLEAFEKSRYQEARQHLEKATKGPKSTDAFLALSRLALVEGKVEQAISFANQAARTGGKSRAEAASLVALALAHQGKLQQAIAEVRKVENDPSARRARITLGELLLLSGNSQAARAPLMTLIQDYNDDTITERDPEGMALVGRAAHLLRSAQDANDAYNEAEKAGTKSVEMLLWRAELFLEKYDTGHAQEVLEEVLKIAPHHPDALVSMAQVKLDQAYDFAAADKLIKKALETNPNHTGAYFIRAGLALRDLDIQAADAAIDQGLTINPHDLPLLSMRAATRFLAEDPKGFDIARKAVLDRNPEFSQLYQIIGEFAEWEHRYDEIVAMMQDAIQVNPRDGKAWAVLGLNLIRLGEDDPGIEALRNAWKFDRFNVRVYNTLNLFEKDIPNHYETTLQGSFRYRFDKKERQLLERHVAPMLEEAFQSMVRRYKFTPRLPVGIELYSDPQHFSVRTSGLPAIGIQGVCFGRTLASMSPKTASFNWGNVLWHELAHVFAIQLSRSRVPRWFTEGLSEYETFLRYPEWQREEDLPLYMALKANRIPKVASFNRAFTHVDNPSDITMAYYAASQIIVYLGEQFGMDAIVTMLRLWGKGLPDASVVKQALGIDMDELDRRFRTWLTPRLARYERQFLPDLHAPSLEDAQRAAKASPNDIQKQVELILALGSEGKMKEAKATLDSLLEAHPKDPLLIYVNARFMMGEKQFDRAQSSLESIVKTGHDGYPLRMLLADLAEAKKDGKAQRAHLEAARRFDPTQVEPLQALHDLAKKEDRKGDVIAALRELSVLDQHEPRAATRLLFALGEMKMWEEVRKVAPRAIFVGLHDPSVHRIYGQALADGKQYDQALFALESAILCEPADEEAVKVYLLASTVYRDMGRDEDARKAARMALSIEPDNKQAQELAQELAK